MMRFEPSAHSPGQVNARQAMFLHVAALARAHAERISFPLTDNAQLG